MNKLLAGWTIFALLILCAGIANAQDVTFQTKYAKLVIEADGRISGIFNRSTGKNYAVTTPANYLATIKQNDKILAVSSVTKTNEGISLVFGNSNVSANIKITPKPNYFEFEVTSVSPDNIQEFTFLDIKLNPAINEKPSFSWAAIAMNLHTNVPALPGLGYSLLATSSLQFGITGSKVAVIGSPSSKMRSIMKEVVYAAKDDVPYNPYGGPWAMDHKFNRGSYIVDCLQTREDTADKWIRICRETGIHQIDINNWNFFNGEYDVNPDYIPGGKEALKRIIKKLHATGIRCGLHTYSFLVGKHSRKYVNPMPDPRLLKGSKFNLATDLNATDTVIPIESNPNIQHAADQATTTGLIVQIGNELISVAGVNRTSPYSFTECTRGLLGTKATAHKASSQASELKQVYDMFIPDVHTTLFKEVAANITNLYNECGFDMMYLDAVDSYGLLDGYENGWYWSTVFVNEIVKRAKKPVMLEGSTLWSGMWFARSRMGAWDLPIRAEKECYDAHFVDNLISEKIFLPPHMGWCDVHKWNPIQPERSFPDDIEYLLCKGMAVNCGLSMQAYLNPDNYMKSENAQRIGKLIRTYEELRTKNYFPESVREKLKVSGADYTLEQDKKSWFFRPVTYAKHKVGGSDASTNNWTVNNKYSSQPIQLRIEALMSIDPYDSPECINLTNYTDNSFNNPIQSYGIASSKITPGSYPELGRTDSIACYKATSNNPTAWVMHGTNMTPPVDCSMKGFGVWIYGDGQGEIINLQNTSPVYTSNGRSDHYIKIDFTGWRYFEFVEPETTDITKYDWPYASKKSEWAYTENGPASGSPRVPLNSLAYSVYILYGTVNSVSTFSIWYNNLPVGKEVTTYLTPVRALTLRTAKIQNPSIEIAGKTITFPVTLESGQYIEYRSMKDCKVYDAEGTAIATITPTGESPVIKNGTNQVTINSKGINGVAPRLNITVTTKGNPITK